MKKFLYLGAFFASILGILPLFSYKLAIEVEDATLEPVLLGAYGIVQPGKTSTFMISEDVCPTGNKSKSIKMNVPLIGKAGVKNQTVDLIINLTQEDEVLKVVSYLQLGTAYSKFYHQSFPTLQRDDLLKCTLVISGDLFWGNKIKSIVLERKESEISSEIASRSILSHNWMKYIRLIAQAEGIGVSTSSAEPNYFSSEGQIALKMHQGYIHMVAPQKGLSLLRGERASNYPLSVTECLTITRGSVNAQRFNAWKLLNVLAGEYKIMCMPRSIEHLDHFLKIFLKVLKDNTTLQRHVHSVEILPLFDDPMSDQEILKSLSAKGGGFLPIIVINPAGSQEAAQYVLDTVYAMFSDDYGIGLNPRFSKKITNFLFYSQGIPEDRLIPQIEGCFKQPKKVFYKDDFETLYVEKDGLQEPYFGNNREAATVCEVHNKKKQILQHKNCVERKKYRLRNPAKKNRLYESSLLF